MEFKPDFKLVDFAFLNLFSLLLQITTNQSKKFLLSTSSKNEKKDKRDRLSTYLTGRLLTYPKFISLVDTPVKTGSVTSQ